VELPARGTRRDNRSHAAAAAHRRHWYKGTADAIYQNIYSLERDTSREVMILAGDHIYKMDYSRMIREHRARKADVTVGCIPVKLEESRQFGIMQVDGENRITRFDEKPAACEPLPNDPLHALGSMGIYVVNTRLALRSTLRRRRQRRQRARLRQEHPPGLIADGKQVIAHRFNDENRKPPATGATWARWMPTFRRTWIWWLSIRC